MSDDFSIALAISFRILQASLFFFFFTVLIFFMFFSKAETERIELSPDFKPDLFSRQAQQPNICLVSKFSGRGGSRTHKTSGPRPDRLCQFAYPTLIAQRIIEKFFLFQKM